ncbi:MAG: alpha/beta hydrolase [Deltaproteobacteria bacterium]|nr:alpha/beta hydrolase [Deltaproteobacteria bacterium]MBI3388064.1 alpha/beta hydrolase [Deltaproteobacteria bacterium]
MSEARFPRQVPGIPRASEHHELREDVVYDEVAGVPLRYDFYRPLRVDAPTPAVVVVHGGGWANGDPSQAAGYGLHFARRGIATISISYRLAPLHPFPAALDDVRRGLRFVRAEAAQFNVDPSRLVLLGMSAGAHLVMLAHVARGLPQLAPDLPVALRAVSEDVRGVIAHYGPFDLRRRLVTDGPDAIAGFLGPRHAEPEWAALASPVLHATHATAPTLLIHGTGDQVVSHRESQRMAEALRAAGREVELLVLDGAPHAFQIDWRGDYNRHSNAAIDSFLGQRFDLHRHAQAAAS